MNNKNTNRNLESERSSLLAVSGRSPLTASHIKYLIALEKLSVGGHGVRCVDLANALSYKKPSVNAMIRTLCRKNLVRYERYGDIIIEEEGRRLARNYSEYAETLKRLLCDIFEPETDITDAVFAFLAEIEPEKIENLSKVNIKRMQEKLS